MALRPLIVLIFVSLIALVFGKGKGELKAVIVMYRHGDRAPISTWPNDEYFGNSSLWSDGYGELNNMGKQRHYRLGQWFRNRYDGFLPARYNRSDIYVRSTDVDRALMSAASNLAGLYPPSGDQIWNDNIQWQSIPIHTTPTETDFILTDKIACPKHDRLLQELLNSSEFQQFNKEHAELFQNISKVTGYPVNDVGLDKFSRLFTDITIYREFNLTLPKWTEEYWPVIKTLAAKKLQVKTYTQNLARLRAGPFNNYLIGYLNDIKNQTKSSKRQGNKLAGIEDTGVRKFLMLSAHDTTIADRTNAMGVYPNAAPEFASTVIWEVKTRNRDDDDLYINMYFKNSTHFSRLVLPGCDFNCNIHDFVNILKPITATIDEWIEECNEE